MITGLHTTWYLLFFAKQATGQGKAGVGSPGQALALRHFETQPESNLHISPEQLGPNLHACRKKSHL